jgi:hypothetical protein
MPAGKRQQSSAMLYTLITFVGLFIVATTVAVIYYIKAEKVGTKAATLQSQIDEMATGAEIRQMGTLIGAKQSRKSRLGTMIDYLDETTAMIIGRPIEETSAEVKAQTAKQRFKETLAKLAPEYPATEEAEPAEAAPAEAAPAEVQNNEVVELLVKEEFAKVTDNFDETMKAALPAEKLGEVWKATIEQAGAFKKQLGSRQEKELEYDVTFVTCEFEKGNLDVKLVYNDKKQIAGMFIVPTPEDVVKKYQSKPEQMPAQENIDIVTADPNTTGLIQIIEKLKVKLDNVTNAAIATQKQLKELQNRFDNAMAANFEKEQTLLAEKEKYQQQVNDIQKNYNDLKALMEQTSGQQIQTLMAQLEEERTNRKNTYQELLKTQAEKNIAEERMKRAQEKLMELVPPPDNEVAAHKPDGKIISIDDHAKTVRLNIGSDNHVYQGLTFSVYDKNMPIPKDGKGKAEVEVFNIDKNVSVARILRSEIKNPIMLDDIVANLIWDSDRTNVFTVAGEFDLDGNGAIDYDGTDKIKALIEKWGGKVTDTVSIDTDFLVLGSAPTTLRRPTFEQTEIDPMAMGKYEASLQKLANYKEAQSLAQTLSIPVFNTERFLYFIGYKEQAGEPGAF